MRIHAILFPRVFKKIGAGLIVISFIVHFIAGLAGVRAGESIANPVACAFTLGLFFIAFSRDRREGRRAARLVSLFYSFAFTVFLALVFSLVRLPAATRARMSFDLSPLDVVNIVMLVYLLVYYLSRGVERRR
ncbi:MAG: hypothetical protein LBD64_03115 [Odoribacteraceae bacterium]|jgi:hypothetical protein|nr:hypothetical protein [Odoribacteraceae bacterium]